MKSESFAIKARRKGSARFAFVSGERGALNHLRVHANRYPTKQRAETMMAILAGDNSAYEFKVVPL